MSLSDVSLRVATAADATKLSAFAARTFVETFAKDNTPEDMDSYLRSAFSPELQAQEIADPDFFVLLAIAPDEELAAYAELVRNPVPPEVGDATALELGRFYIAKDWQGHGLAQRLMHEVRVEAVRRGAATLWLGVWEHNARAIAFYRKQGYREVGSHPFMVGSDRQTDLLMAASLADSANSAGTAGSAAGYERSLAEATGSGQKPA